MQMHLNLYSLKLLALVDTGCNTLHENCAKMGPISLFSRTGKSCLFFLYSLICLLRFRKRKQMSV